MDRWKESRRSVVQGGLSPRLKRTGEHDQGFPVEEVGGRGTQNLFVLFLKLSCESKIIS